MIKKILKSFFKPFYQRFISKLREGLETNEQFRLLNHLVEQNINLKKDVAILQHEINMLNILIGGIESQKGSDAFALTPEDTTKDIINILAPQDSSDVTIVQLLNKIGQNTFKDKSVALIGAGTAFFKKELERRGASQITSIEMNPLLLNEYTRSSKDNTVYVSPSKMNTVNIPMVDILFVAHSAAAAYLLKRKLLHIGPQVKELGFFLLSGDKQQRKQLTTLITGSGFTHVSAVPDGEGKSFDYLDLRELPKKTVLPELDTVLYKADKLPSVS